MAFWLRLFLLIGFLATQHTTAWAADAVVGHLPGPLRMGHGVEVLVEAAGERFSPTEVMAPALAPRWRPFSGSIVAVERQPGSVWARFNLVNEGQADAWVVSVNIARLAGVDFHQFDPATSRWVGAVTFRPGRVSDTELPKGPNPAFSFRLAPGERTTLVMRVDGSRPVLLPLLVWHKSAFVDAQRNSVVLDALLMGAVGVMLFYNLSLFIFTRDTAYREYAAYLGAIALNNLTLSGLGPMYLWGENAWFMQHGIELIDALASLTSALFFRRFLRLDQAPRHINWINLTMITLSVFFVAWSFKPDLFGSPALLETLGVPAVLFGCVTAIYMSYRLAFSGNLLARYVAIAWTTLLLSVIYVTLALKGYVDSGPWTKHLIQIGHVVEATLLSVALAARIRMQQNKSLELKRKVEHERDEKLRAQEQAKLDLERRVDERTVELQHALQSVEQANVELARLSVTDALTQAHNRRYFDEVLHSEYQRSQRTGSSFALLLADIDRFKHINDSFGHVAGDECLRLVARALSAAASRSTDLVARYGGEEFALILPGIDTENAMQVAERARQAVENIAFTVRGQRVALTVSIGVHAGAARPGQSVAEFVADADAALYVAKREGRNRVRQSQWNSAAA